MIRILLVDDQKTITDYLQSILETHLDVEVVGTADNGKIAIQQVAKLQPDVVLIDMEMPDLDGISATKIIHQRFPDTKVLVLSGYDKNEYVHQSLDAGAMGYILKNASPEELTDAIRLINKGYTQLAPGLIEKVIQKTPEVTLVKMDTPQVINYPFFPTKKWWIILLLLVTSLVLGITTIYTLIFSQTTQPNPSSASLASDNYATNAVSAQGRIEPKGKVIRLSASTTLGTIKIDKLLVKEGDRVKSNQVIAILDQYHRLLAGLKQAQQQVKIAQANLAKVKAGAKTGEINAQKAQISRLQAQILGERKTQQANIARLEAQLSNAQTEFGRFQMLYKEGAVEASKFDSKRLEMETAKEQLKEAKANLNQTEATLQQQINQAQATLNQIAEIRPTDVQAAQAEVASAEAAVNKAQADLNLAYVRAPQDGQILKIYTYPGEIIDDQGIADMGQTDQMYVVAEVYETDVSRVRIGQKATITSEAFRGELHGTVTQVSLQVRKQAMFNTDPVADVDRRVVEVKIRLHPKDTKQVTSLTNLQVEVVINTDK